MGRLDLVAAVEERLLREHEAEIVGVNPCDIPGHRKLREQDRVLIRTLVRVGGWSVHRVARAFGITRTTVYNVLGVP